MIDRSQAAVCSSTAVGQDITEEHGSPGHGMGAAGDVAHTRSITSNIITGAIATGLALTAASAARGRTGNSRRGTGPAAQNRTMPRNL
ncbi:hypothetical protein BX281_0518 [Streptomyces sp. Ag82_O1-15]|uniref:hypothetical protein n=1 Tax=Streptomyces sp. Ag82_O1-15 TaxID=1938855 RepID=UPI000BB10DB8|nr:hypothetical protein [Streptomyces sp. Ag82_O1-15]PBC92806.1 hypothetical protein BX281_0518 [Streptomyces sp. Ag82_O1-15]